MTNLILLDFNHNQLAGQIPDELATMKQLKVLMLSQNKLEGDIPESFIMMDDLQTMILNDKLNINSGTRIISNADFVTTKLSQWLAHGCISPRMIAMECKKYEKERIENKSTYWVVSELIWRDYCKFFAVKHEDSIFYLDCTFTIFTILDRFCRGGPRLIHLIPA